MELKELEKLLNQKGSEKRILAFFRGASEKDRQAFSKHCGDWFKKHLNYQRKNWMVEVTPGTFTFESNKLLNPAIVAAYCCCPLATVKTGGWHARISSKLVYEALADRRPTWASAWLEHRLSSAWPSDWIWYRRLIREGICDKPENEDYIRLMIDGFDSHNVNGKRKILNVAKEVLADPDLMESDFWRIFEVPGTMRDGSLRGYLNESWLAGILKLESLRKLDRGRLFRSILATPNMGFNQAQIKFFLSLHDKLLPSKQETAEMVKDYVGLLDSALPPVAKWSLETLLKADRQKLLANDLILESLPIVTRMPVKSQVKAGIKWAMELIKRAPQETTKVLLAVCDGLIHEKSDLQTEVWDFVRRYATADSKLESAIRDRIPMISVSTRKQVQKWLDDNFSEAKQTKMGKEKSKKSTSKPKIDSRELRKRGECWQQLCSIDQLLVCLNGDPQPLPPAIFNGMEFKRIDDEKRLVSIQSQEELIEIASAVIEDSNRFEDAERVLEAMGRIKFDGNQKSVSPILKRMRQILKRSMAPFKGAGLHFDIIPILAKWCESGLRWEEFFNKDRYLQHGPVGLVGYLGTWFESIYQQQLAGKTPVTIATMSHSGGWIDPMILVQRVNKIKNTEVLSQSDKVLSLLRLAPDHRSRALSKLKQKTSSKGEYIDALRYALGDDVRIGKSAPLWVAAARSRAPFDDDPAVEMKFPELGPDTGTVAKFAFRPKRLVVTNAQYEKPSYEYLKAPKLDFPTALTYQFCRSSAFEALDTKPEPRSFSQSGATVWPLNRDGFYLERSAPADDLEPLFDSNTPLHQTQMAAIVDSMISGYVVYAAEVAAAVDLTITAISDGRFDAMACGKLLALRIDSVSRFAKALSTVAQTSRLHAFVIAMVIIEMFEHNITKMPVKISDLLLLLFEIIQELEMELPAKTKIVLGKQFTGSGKAAKLCRQMIEFQPEQNFDFESIVIDAINGRLESTRILLPE